MESGSDFYVRMLRSLASYILDHHGQSALERAAEDASLDPQETMPLLGAFGRREPVEAVASIGKTGE